jgi:beta-galactosidase
MTFCIKEGSFYLDDRKVFLNSGEIHYFRINRRLWDKHLEAAKEAGLTTVSTYVPWAWHNPKHFFVDGILPPTRSELASTMSALDYIACKTRPVCLASFGAPDMDWFLDQYSRMSKCATAKANSSQRRSQPVSFKVPLKVTLWYDKSCFIHEHEISAGGPVIMVQICNEIGVFS